MPIDIQIYTKTDCPFCLQAKQWFAEHSIEYTEHLMNEEEERLAFYQRINNVTEQLGVGRNGINSVPQIYMNNERVGGYADLIKIQDKILKARGGGLTVASETYKPFYYAWAVDLTVRHEKAHWIEDEVDLGEDVSDWKTNKVTPVEKDYITNILRLFTQSDVAVGQNYYDQFIPKFKNNEVRNMLGSFASREGVHQRAYALLNDTLGLPDSEYHAFLEYKEMTDKIDFMQKSDNTTQRGLALALAKSVCNEGVALFASFVMLLNFQRVGKMKGMGKVVEWSIRDESMHVEGNSRLFKAFVRTYVRDEGDLTKIRKLITNSFNGQAKEDWFQKFLDARRDKGNEGALRALNKLISSLDKQIRKGWRSMEDKGVDWNNVEEEFDREITQAVQRQQFRESG